MSMDLVTEKEILEPLVDGQEVLWSLCTHSGSCTINTPIYHYRAIIFSQDYLNIVIYIYIYTFIIIFIYFSIVLNAGSPCLLRILLVNFITAIFVSVFNVKFSSFFEFEGVLELEGLDNLY